MAGFEVTLYGRIWVTPKAGKGYTADRSLRDLALEVILARFHHRSKLAQIAKDMRNAVGAKGFNPELRRAIQTFIKVEVESDGGRLCARTFFHEARKLVLEASAPQTATETSAEFNERRDLAISKARIAQAAGLLLQGV
jgi:hypothetical protein